MILKRRALAEGAGAAVCGYIVAAILEATLIHWVRPTEWELAWVSDAALAIGLGIAVYLWRHLVTARRELQERERDELVLQTQLSVAAEIQRRLLPAVPPTDDGFEWAAALTSAGKIGGDFYDFVQIAPKVWIVLVADVSGKGIPAAMALGSLRSAFRTLARQSSDPARIVTQLSTVLYEEWLGSPYVTCVVGTFDLTARTVTYTNAGHPPGIVAGSDGIRHLNRGGPAAGLLPDAQFDQELVSLRSGDVCLLVSDGVTEALEGEAPLERDLAASTARHRPVSAAELCQTVMARALRGRGPRGVPEWDDDRTVVVLKVLKRQAADPEVFAAGAGTKARVDRGLRNSMMLRWRRLPARSDQGGSVREG
jgi:sigma-B regulation protein RsbU (phosphoserine phosphatase)